MKQILLLVMIFAFSAALFAQQSEPTPPPPTQSAPAPETSTPPTPPPPPSYTPKFRGDPARSDSEAVALAYMRVVMRAEVGFNKHYGHYATTLRELVHSGTFTQRMVNPERGDYTVGYKGKKDNYILTMAPKALDATHRWFYVDDDGKIRADEAKPADANSDVVETHRF